MTEDLRIEARDTSLPATLAEPDVVPVGGIVPLHGATAPRRDFFLYEHLATLLPEHAWSVLRYDRRPAERMVPLATQADDALAAVDLLRTRLPDPDSRIGLWGVSQGAWTAVLAAGRLEIDLLVLVGFSGISPGKQMRYYTRTALTEAGHGSDHDLEELDELRSAYESYLRGDLPRRTAQAVVDRLTVRPWFELAWVPAELPDRETLPDPYVFDFDPEAALADVTCPVVAFYGELDREVPVEESVEALQRAFRGDADRLTVHRYPNAAHDLTIDAEQTLDPAYERDLVRWLGGRSDQRG